MTPNKLASFYLPGRFKCISLSVLLTITLLSAGHVSANYIFHGLPADTIGEDKIDYIARIYFSGEGKDDLNIMVMTTLQELEGAHATASVARQYAFLSGIKAQLGSSETTCDLLELMAAGMYDIDAITSSTLKVLAPSAKAKMQVGGTLQSMNSTFGNVNNSLANTAYSTYVLSNGRTNIYNTANTVSRAAGTANAAVGMVSSGAQIVGEGKKVFRALGGGTGRCKKVPVQTIEIGKHELSPEAQQNMLASQGSQSAQVSGPNVSPTSSSTKAVTPKANGSAAKPATAVASADATTTVINIAGINSNTLRTFTDAVQDKEGVQSAIRSFSEAMSTLTVVHAGSTDDLADWIEDKFGSKYKMVGYTAGKITITPKAK